MAGIFISYRRDDDRYAAGRLADELASEFGPENLFRDIESIAPGQDFEVALNTALASCAVMLVVIGPRWLDITDAQGRRRLEQDGDWVRTEVARALERDIPVIPVLLDGTPLPTADQLPADLQALPRRQKRLLSDANWRSDVDGLVKKLLLIPGLKRKPALRKKPTPPRASAAVVAGPVNSVPRRRGLAGLGSVAALGFAGVLGWEPLRAMFDAPPPPPHSGALPQTWRWSTQDRMALDVQLQQQGESLAGRLLHAGREVGAVTGRFNGIRADVNLRMGRTPGKEIYARCELQWTPERATLQGHCQWPGAVVLETWTAVAR